MAKEEHRHDRLELGVITILWWCLLLLIFLVYRIGGALEFIVIFATGIILLVVKAHFTIMKYPPLVIYENGVTVENFPRFLPWPRYGIIQFGDIVEIREKRILFSKWFQRKKAILFTTSDGFWKYVVLEDFLENITFGDIINAIVKWRSRHKLPPINYVNEKEKCTLLKSPVKASTEVIDVVWDEPCPVCPRSIKHIEKVDIKHGQKTAKATCFCGYVSRKKITENMLKERTTQINKLITR